MLSGFDYYKYVIFEKYADFDGRASRKEYWYFVLFNALICWALTFLDWNMGLGIASTLYSIGMFIPGLAVTIRRLHDTGKSGWWYLLVFTVIGVIVLLFFLIEEGEPDSNQYGISPHTPGFYDTESDHYTDLV